MACSVDIVVLVQTLYVGGDWACRSDNTWLAVGTNKKDVFDWLKVPNVPLEEQVQIAKECLFADRDGWRYIDPILGVRCDSTGDPGAALNEMLRTETSLP